jgi:hypothetical protein
VKHFEDMIKESDVESHTAILNERADRWRNKADEILESMKVGDE